MIRRRFVKDEYIAEEQVALLVARNKVKEDALLYGLTCNDINARLYTLRLAFLANRNGRIGRLRLLLACVKAAFSQGAK